MRHNFESTLIVFRQFVKIVRSVTWYVVTLEESELRGSEPQ